MERCWEVRGPKNSPDESEEEGEDDEGEKCAHLEILLQQIRQDPPLPSHTQSREFREDEILGKKGGVEGEERLEFLLRMQNNFSDSFENGLNLHPHGLTEFDHCIIPDCKAKALDELKIQTRRGNYAYLASHQELEALIAVFIKRLLKAKPEEAVKYAAEFFGANKKGTHIYDQTLKQMGEELAKIRSEKKIKVEKDKKSGSNSTIENVLKIANEIKSLALGPSAHPFDLNEPTTHQPHEKIKIKKAKKPKSCEKKFYCGCKDPGRREISHPSS